MSVRRVYEKPDLIRQLRALGIESGDTVVVRVDFGKMGRLKIPGDRTFMESLLEAVGARGTILAQTHSPCQLFFRRDRSYVYEPHTAPCLTGRFAETVWQWDVTFRSLHPTCSMAGIGYRARDLLADHDHTASCFAPLKPIIQAGGKQLIVGCTVSSPGFSSIHYTYEHLGLANRSLLSGWIGCYFKIRDRVSWFRQRDIPGCSLGFHKFYPLYRAHSALCTGLVGDAESYLVGAADAFRIECAAVAQNPKRYLCDDPHCFSCRGTKLFNPFDIPRYYLTHVPAKVMKLFKNRPSPTMSTAIGGGDRH